jgi:hypothetical protein
MAWQVEDIEAVINPLRARRIVFEEYHLPGLATVNAIAAVAGNYPSKGRVGERAAWFKDPDGNLLAIGPPARRPGNRRSLVAGDHTRTPSSRPSRTKTTSENAFRRNTPASAHVLIAPRREGVSSWRITSARDRETAAA